MIITGLKLTILGMGVVISFLLLLILIVNISYKLLAGQTARELAAMDAVELKKRKKSHPAEQKNVLVAVITAAIAAHRNRGK
ncbi:OadG family protein [bacterium]|nr:OadG family protein [bacterium]